MAFRRIGTTGKPQEVKSNLHGMAQLPDGSWVNKEVKPISHIMCYVPLKIQYLMEDINSVFKNTEFSVYLKYEEVEEGIMIVDNEFIIPKQEVSAGHVDYDEDAPEGFNCVAHKHPNNMTNFSTTDENYINSNFDVSLLWTSNKEFVNGHVRVKTQYGYVKIPIKFDLEVQYRDIIVSEEYIKSKIRKYNPPKMANMHTYGKVKTRLGKRNSHHQHNLDTIRSKNQKQIEELWGDEEFTLWGGDDYDPFINTHNPDDGSSLIDVDEDRFRELTSGVDEIKGNRENDTSIDWKKDEHNKNKEHKKNT